MIPSYPIDLCRSFVHITIIVTGHHDSCELPLTTRPQGQGFDDGPAQRPAYRLGVDALNPNDERRFPYSTPSRYSPEYDPGCKKGGTTHHCTHSSIPSGRHVTYLKVQTHFPDSPDLPRYQSAFDKRQPLF